MNIFIYINIYVYIYVERERELLEFVSDSVSVRQCWSALVLLYREEGREGGRDRESARGKEGERDTTRPPSKHEP